MLLMSLGSGSGCDTQFLFSDDILGDYDERLPRHAKAYRDFNAEIQRLQTERIAAFGEYIADVNTGQFPGPGNLIEIGEEVLKDIVEQVKARDGGSA